MYGGIRKEVVMNMVKWLKENNEHYKNIELNDLWDDEWMQSGFDTLLQPTGTKETQTGVQNDNVPSDLDNLPAIDPAKNPIHSDSFKDFTVTNMDSPEDT